MLTHTGVGVTAQTIADDNPRPASLGSVTGNATATGYNFTEVWESPETK